jgi:hypothetical protein
MTEYAILIYGDESQFDQTPEAWAAMMDAHGAFAKAVAEQGAAITGGNALQPRGTATSIRGGSAVTDGPFVETKETLGGFYLIDCRDLDQAFAIAKLCPAPAGGVEVRPVADTSGA